MTQAGKARPPMPEEDTAALAQHTTIDALHHPKVFKDHYRTFSIIMDPDRPVATEPQPSIFRWIIGFLMVGACWGLTTPFMRKAAMYAYYLGTLKVSRIVS